MTTKLVKTPVYQQLNDLLRSLLHGGGFHEGDRFLTERQIAERFEVSRATANKALSNLVSEGLLQFRKGLGTFVSPEVLDLDLGLLVSFTARARAKGRTPETRVLQFRKCKGKDVDQDVVGRLGGGHDDDFFEMQRLRFADGTAVIVEHRIVVARLCPALNEEMAARSLYTTWTKDFDLQIGGAEQTIRAVAIDETIGQLLGLPGATPCLAVEAIGYLHDSTALWWEHTTYRGDAYEFHNQLGNGPWGRRDRGSTLQMASR